MAKSSRIDRLERAVDTLERAASVDASKYRPVSGAGGGPLAASGLAGPPPQPLVPPGPRPGLIAKLPSAVLSPNIAQQQTRVAQVPFIDIPMTQSVGATQQGITQNAATTAAQVVKPAAAIVLQAQPKTVSLSQYAYAADIDGGTGQTVTLTYTPTPGNTLLAFASLTNPYNVPSIGLPSGFTSLSSYVSPGGYHDAITIGSRTVEAGDGKSWAFTTNTDTAACISCFYIFELLNVTQIAASTGAAGTQGSSGGPLACSTGAAGASGAVLVICEFLTYQMGKPTGWTPSSMTEFAGPYWGPTDNGETNPWSASLPSLSGAVSATCYASSNEVASFGLALVSAAAAPVQTVLSGTDLPLLAKGSLITANGSQNVILPVGANGTILTADSTQPCGLGYEAVGFTPAGDLSGSGNSQEVVGIQSKPIDGGPTDGDVLKYSSSSGKWEPTALPGGFSAGGDLSGTGSSQEVVGIQSKPIDGGPTDGDVLKYSSSSGKWEPTALPGGFTAGGDLSGTGSSQEVVGIQSKPIDGGPTDGDVLKYSSSSGKWEPTALPSTSGLASQAGVQDQSYTYAADSGSANAYVVTLSPAPGSLVAGLEVCFKAAHSNTSASTLNVNGLSSGVAIFKNGTQALTGGEIVAGGIVTVIYDGTQWQWATGLTGATGSSATAPYSGRQGDGSTGQVTVAGIAKTTSGFSVSLWFKPTQTPQYSTSAPNKVGLSHVVAVASYYYNTFFLVWDSHAGDGTQGGFSVGYIDGNSYQQQKMIQIPSGNWAGMVNVWSHLALTITAAGAYILYLNGAVVASGTISYFGSLTNGTGPLYALTGYINASGTGTSPTCFSPYSVAECAYWPTTVLSAAEVSALAAGEPASIIEPSTLKVYWKFAGLPTEPDFSSNGNSGTVTDTTVIAGPSGTAAVGLVGNTGAPGATGAQGDKGGLRYAFDTTTGAGTSGNGDLRFNNATVASVTAIYLDYHDVNGVDLHAYVDHWADSTSTVKGYLLIKENSNAGTPFAIFSVSAVVDHSTYTEVDVAFVAGTAPANGDAVVVEWIRTGDIGATGQQGPAGGSFVLLEQHVASNSAQLDFTASISSTYDDYVVEIVGLLPATNNTGLCLQFSSDGGSTWLSDSNYSVGRYYCGVTQNNSAYQSLISQAYLPLYPPGDLGNQSTGGLNARIRILNPLSTVLYKVLDGQISAWNSAPNLYSWAFGATYKSTTAVNAFRIYANSGNLASGLVRVYGLAKL